MPKLTELEAQQIAAIAYYCTYDPFDSKPEPWEVDQAGYAVLLVRPDGAVVKYRPI